MQSEDGESRIIRRIEARRANKNIEIMLFAIAIDSSSRLNIAKHNTDIVPKQSFEATPGVNRRQPTP